MNRTQKVVAVLTMSTAMTAVAAVSARLGSSGLGKHRDNGQEGGNAEPQWDLEQAASRIRAEEQARLAARVERTEGELETRMVEAVLESAPYYRSRPSKAMRLVSIIHDAAKDHGIDPWLALSMAFRESSLLPSVGSGRRRGALGEVGYFQIMPSGYATRVCGSGRPLTSPEANAATAMCYLSHLREICQSDDPAIYVAAYSMSRCPSSSRGAMGITATRRAREYLCQMAGQQRCNAIWPTAT